MKIENQTELKRKESLKALKNYELSDNFKKLTEEIERIKKEASDTIITLYLQPSEDPDENGDYTFTEKKKYSHNNKFAWGIEQMTDIMSLIDDSEGGKIIKDRIRDGIKNSTEHLGLGMIKVFPGSGNMVEYRYSDIEFTATDRLKYKAQVAGDTIAVLKGLIEEYSKEPEQEYDISPEEES